MRDKWVIFDLDSTLADTSHRRDCIPTPDNGRSWQDYADRCLEDEPIEGTIALSRILFRSGLNIMVLSARPDKAATDTQSWLGRNAIPCHDLVLAPPEVKTSIDIREYKISRIRDRQEKGWKFQLAIDDGKDAEEMYRACGIPCITVMSWYVRDLLNMDDVADNNTTGV